MSNDVLRIGLVGVGGVCDAVHYPGFSRIPGVEIAGICEPSDALRAARKAEWGIDACYAELGEMLAEVKPDAVAIATPNVYHRELILQALEAGCHVMCEKPLGMDYAETRLIYEAAKSSGLRHMTAFTYRFVPALNYIRHLVHSG